jgi:subtilase family serine protease
MKKSALFPLLGIMVLLGASLSFTQSTGSQHGVVIVPYSTQEMPWDVGVRAHTNHLIFVPAGHGGVNPAITGPAGETPGSLSCVYQTQSTVDGVAGCTISGTSGTTLSGGSGIIAIVDAFDYPTAQTDFDTFSSQFGLPLSTSTCGSGPCFQKVFATGRKPRANCGWAQEAALDIEWSHAMAPNARIVLVEAASNSFSNLFAAVDVATSIVAGKGEVSMSWGGSEFSSESSNDFHFNNSGVVYFASSGDTGGKVIYPSASPNVVSAGGTSVNRSNGVDFSGESAWSSGGGGPSADEPRPSYQSAVATIVGSQRGTPDFSFDSDPNTGVSVFDSTSCQGFSGWQVFGGTSVASPSLSGIVNLASSFASNSGSELATIYRNLGTSNFRDITSGSNGFPALVGWDFTTGVGSNIGTNGK